MYSDARLALSMAASWSWGSSLLVGVSIMQGMGPGAFAIWAVFNVLAVPLFIVVADRTTLVERVRGLRPVFATMILLQLFVVFINLQAISEGVAGGLAFDSYAFVSMPAAMILAMALGGGIVVAIHRYGFRASVVSDQMQYMFQLGACLALIVTALLVGGSATQHGTATAGEHYWAVWTGLGILAAPYLDAQQHQREHHLDDVQAGILFGVAFGVYLVAVAAVGSLLVSATPVLTALLLVAVLAVTTSTLDSAVAGLQYLLSRRRAAILAGSAVLVWPLLQSLGVLGIFTLYSTGRLIVVSLAVAYMLLWQDERLLPRRRSRDVRVNEE